MLVVRPAKDDDLDHFISLARQAGPGFTSLAVSDKILEKRLEKSVKSFAGPSDISPDHLYLLMLEDTDTGQIVGMSAIKAQIGIQDPFFNFRILNVAQQSAVTDKRYDMEVLILVNEYAGASEVGTLFVSEAARGRGAGRLISQARYMLMAIDQNRFGDLVISELRGHVDDTGYSPFWEAIGRKFFLMDFVEADNFSAEKDNQFILDLMPKYPIYAALLPEDAQKAMGQAHAKGGAARRYLREEGFRYNGVIDIFDGGPSVSVPKEDIRTVAMSRVVPITDQVVDGAELMVLISNNKVKDFRCAMAPVTFGMEDINIPQNLKTALGLKLGDNARICIKQ